MKWAALLLAVLLAGCGGENKQAPGSSGHFEGEASKVAAVIGEYQRAFHRADGTHICRELIPEGHRPPRCERAMAQLAVSVSTATSISRSVRSTFTEPRPKLMF